MKFNSFGSEKNGQQLYISIFAGTACIRVLELEQSFKYNHNMSFTIFNFDKEIQEKKGFYNFIKTIVAKEAFREIPEVKEFCKEYFNERYLELLKKEELENTEEKKFI